MTSTESIDIEWIKEIAREGGELIKDNIADRSKKVSCKMSNADLVTETDLAVEALLVNKIKSRYPSHSFLCEESATANQKLSDEPTWIIDPVDGTTNFVHNVPLCAVSIGFAVKGIVQCGVVYNPSTDEMYYAERQKGAYCNGHRLRTTGQKEISAALVTTGLSVNFAHRMQNENLLDAESKAIAEHLSCVEQNIKSLVLNCCDVRRFGSLALDLCFLASGRVDGCVEMTPKEWDIAAGWVIVEEAGGVMRDYDNGELDIGCRRVLAAASPHLAEALAKVLVYPGMQQSNKK